MKDSLHVGASMVDITPPVGTALAGSLKPRPSEGVQDPLTARAVAMRSGGVTICYVLLDICLLSRKHGDAAVAMASERTGIPADHILWATSHTHTGPYTESVLGDAGNAVNHEWIESLPGMFADAVEQAVACMRPAQMTRTRGYCYDVSHNRRLKFKDGREINRWLLNRGEESLQSIGTAGPIDPEIGIICFDDTDGKPIAVLWNFSLHANKNFGPYFSADFPGVVAARLVERFGPGVVSVFMPGACGDINPLCDNYRQVGDILASEIIKRLDSRGKGVDNIRLASAKADLTVPWRDPDAQDDSRITMSQWDSESQRQFRAEIEYMKSCSVRDDNTVIQAWRIGETGFASLPGEAFVNLGLRIKQESPFPWTYPVELGGDYLGYLVTEQAWKAGGYESLVARLARPSVEGVNMMVEKALELLRGLY